MLSPRPPDTQIEETVGGQTVSAANEEGPANTQKNWSEHDRGRRGK